MGIRGSAVLAVLAALTPGVPVADCQCLCMDGSWKTLCTSVSEAQSGRDRCAARAPQQCPVALSAPEPDVYPAPAERAANCRDARVFDAAAGGHVALRVCDVIPEP